MEKKFESELGKRIVEGKKRQSTINMGVIAAAVVSFALLVGSAVFLMPAIAGVETSGKPVYFESLVTGQVDYLVNVDGQLVNMEPDPVEDFDVKRVMTLKEGEFSSPSEVSPAEYNKFVYTINVNLKDLELFVPEGAVVGELAIEYPALLNPTVSWSMNLNGVVIQTVDDGLETPFVSPVSFEIEAVGIDGINNEIIVTVLLPDLAEVGLDYASGGSVTIQTMVKMPWYYDTIAGNAVYTESVWTAYPDHPLYPPEAIITADATEVAAGATVSLDGSSSTDELGIVAYVWSVDGVEVGTDAAISLTFDVAGTHVVLLVVTDGDGLSDSAEQTITVLEPAP